MQHLVSAVRKGSISRAEPKRYWEPDYQPGDNCAEIRDAIHAQAQAHVEAQVVSQRAPKIPPHSRSQSTQVKPSVNQYSWQDGVPPRCENLEHNHNYACYDKCFDQAPPRLPLDFPVVMNPNVPGGANGGGGQGNDANYRQLKDYVRELRTAVDTLDPGRRKPGDVDVVFAKYMGMRDQGLALCKVLLELSIVRKRTRHLRTVSATSTAISPAVTSTVANSDRTTSATDWDRTRAGSDGVTAGSGPGGTLTRRATAVTDANAEKAKEKEVKIETRPDPKPTVPVVWLEAVRGWKSCVERLAAAHKTSLGDTYKRYEHFATPEILDALFSDRRSRQTVVSSWLKNFGAYKRIQGHSEVATKWETQFQSYDRLVEDLNAVNELLAAEESGTAIPVQAQEITITSRGDAILEFAQTGSEWKPTLRFRVSSSMLAETSPIFARMFAGSTQDLDHLDGTDEDLSAELPPAPTPFTYQEGTRVLVYKMPQQETNTEGALTLLLHAAHMRNDQIPREISFSRFVAVAEAAMKYRCTSPLELFVEHRWLPQWMHMAQEDMPDGLVTISYAFGLRGLFTRATKSVIMNVVDEEGLYSKKWPLTLKEKIWNVRRAKMAQVYASCAAAIEEYLRPATSGGDGDGTSIPPRDDGSISPTSTAVRSPVRSSVVSSPLAMFAPPLMSALSTFSSTPRCPKGSHWCDATNLGWLMLVYNQLQLLSPILQATFLAGSNSGPPPRSLAQIVEALTSIASPPNPVHPGRGVCDPIPTFRSAINDIYNSVCGLTLYDIDGKHHGWALSRSRRYEPQMVLQVGPRVEWETPNKEAFTPSVSDGTFAAEEPRGPTEEAFETEAICLRIMENLESFKDLHSISMVNWSLRETYKENELSLMRNIVKADRRKTMMILLGGNQAEGKDLKQPEPSPSINGILTMIGKKAVEDTSKTRQGVKESEDVDEDSSRDGDTNSALSSDGEDTAVQSEEEQGIETMTDAGTTAAADGSDTTTVQGWEDVTRAAQTQVEPLPISPISPAPTYVTIEAPEPTPYFKMTIEEAQRILWPDATPPVSPREPDTHAGVATGSVMRASAALEQLELETVKFRVEGSRKVEGKTLVMVTDKQLRQDFDTRLRLRSS